MKSMALNAQQVSLLCSNFTAATGRNLFFMIVTWMIMKHTHQPSLVAQLLAAGTIAELLTSNLGGNVVDRFNRRIICLISDVLRVLTMAAATYGLLTSNPIPFLFTTWVIFSVIDRTVSTSQQAMIPELAKDGCLIAFNARWYFAMQLGNFIAASAVGVILIHSDESYLMLAPMACFALSFLGLSGRKWKAGRKDVQRRPTFRKPPILSMRLPQSSLRLCALIYSLVYAMGMLVNVLGSALSFRELGGSALAFSAVEGVWAAGSVVGCLYLFPQKRRTGPLVWHLLFCGSVLALFIAVVSFPFVLLQFFFLGISYNIVRVVVDVHIQEAVPRNLFGRSRSQVHTICVAVGFMTYGFAGFLGNQVNPSGIFALFGLIMMIVGLIILTWHRRFNTASRTI